MCYSSHAPKVLHLHDPVPDPCASWSWGASPKHVSASKNQKTTIATSVILHHKTTIQADRRLYDVYLMVFLVSPLFLLFLLSFTYCRLVDGSVLFHPSHSEPWLLDWHSNRPCPREQTLGGCRPSAIWCVKNETHAFPARSKIAIIFPGNWIMFNHVYW